jgi:two-component system copper resistance phosphate regulon response regulator CusR
MLTAKANVEDRVQGLDAGADDYLVKPFAFAEFLARIRALIRRRERDVPAPLTVADLALDVVSHEVTRGGQRIELTSREYSVLEFLLRNRGRVVTRTTMIEHVWDMHFDSDTNLVDVYIRHLRAKLDDPFPVKLIHTVRGVGYVIKDA